MIHWTALIRHFVTAAADVTVPDYPLGKQENPEGWHSLTELFEGTDGWNSKKSRATIILNAALLEDMGMLVRREYNGEAKFRPTYKAYAFIYGWPALEEDSGPGGTK